MPLKRRKESLFSFKKWTRKPPSKPSDCTISRLSSDSSLSSLDSLNFSEASSEIMASGTGTKPKKRGEEEASDLEDKLTGLLKSAVKDIAGQISDLGRDLGKEIKEVKTELSKNTGEMKRMADKIDQVAKLAKKNEATINIHHEKIDRIERRMVYMEDYGRRSNIKLINFEVQNIQDLKKEVMEWVNSIMGAQPCSVLDFERIHFIGNPKAKLPRPIIVRFSTYVIKEQFMANIRSSPALLNRGSKTVQVYQDLSKETVEWRKSMKPMTSVLLKNQMRFSWGFPLFLKVWKGAVLHRVYSIDEGMELLRAWNLEVDQTGSTGTASKP